MKLLKWLGFTCFLLIILYFLGPHPAKPNYDPQLPVISVSVDQLDEYISNKEAKLPN